jgi:hypothetical protein
MTALDLTVAELRSVVLGWSGDETVTVRDALAELSAAAEAGIEGERRNAEMQAEVQTWLAGRAAAARTASVEAEREHAGEGEPRRRCAGQEGRRPCG